MLAMVVSRQGNVRPVDQRTRIQAGDVVTVGYAVAQESAVSSHLEELGWVPAEAEAV